MKATIGLALLLLLGAIDVRGAGRPGVVEFSDGRKLAGALSLTPGKELRVLMDPMPISLALAQVKEIRFKPEKEEMREGYYFPDAGQATQAKTGEVYPVRYLIADLMLTDGKILTGHLTTTTLYIETEDSTQKVVLVAKQTGGNGEKMEALVYPSAIRFDDAAPDTGTVQISLAAAGFAPLKDPVMVMRPELTVPSVSKVAGKPLWSVATGHPERLLFAAEAADGIHVAWPAEESAPGVTKAVQEGLAVMHDFFDTRTLLGCFTEGDDVYSLVMLRRVDKTYGFASNKEPWSLVVLRWNYDPEAKRVTLLNRALLVMGRAQDNYTPPPVLKEPGLLKAISPAIVPAP